MAAQVFSHEQKKSILDNPEATAYMLIRKASRELAKEEESIVGDAYRTKRFLPESRREEGLHVYKKFVENFGALEKISEGYKKLELGREVFSRYAKHIDNPKTLQIFLQRHPGYRDNIKDKNDFLKAYNNILQAENEHIKKWGSTLRETASLKTQLYDMVHGENYVKKKAAEKTTHSENFIMAAMVAVFGGSVVWALSQVSPENVVVGNFLSASGGSSVPLLMLGSVVAFVAFFLFHHRLK